MAKTTKGAPPALPKTLNKVEAKISGKYVWGSLDSKLKLGAFAIDPAKLGAAKLFRLGDHGDTLKEFTGVRIEYTRR